MKKTSKYQYVRVIQQAYGMGWEDVSEYSREERDLLRHDLKEYRMTGYPTRVIDRRVLTTNN